MLTNRGLHITRIGVDLFAYAHPRHGRRTVLRLRHLWPDHAFNVIRHGDHYVIEARLPDGGIALVQRQKLNQTLNQRS